VPKKFCLGCEQLVDRSACTKGRCPPCARKYDAERGTAAQRGYGAAHQAERERQLAQWAPGQPCAIGGEPLVDRSRLDLAHNAARTGYLGLACWDHNRGHG
jgi:hypothetical protein